MFALCIMLSVARLVLLVSDEIRREQDDAEKAIFLLRNCYAVDTDILLHRPDLVAICTEAKLAVQSVSEWIWLLSALKRGSRFNRPVNGQFSRRSCGLQCWCNIFLN